MAKSRIAEAYVQIVPVTTGMQAALTTEMNKAGGAAGEAMGGSLLAGAKKFVGPLIAAFSIGAVVNLTRDAINAASDLNEAGTAVGAVFGSASSEIDKWASAAATALGQSKVQALDAARTFGVYGQAAGLSAEENAKFSTGLANLSSDFASFYNASPEEAIQAIGAALRGEAEPIRRFGILLDDATLRSKALEMGLISTTKEALTPQQKVLAAQASIMEQAGVAQGDFARTSDGLANQQRILAAQLENTKASIGEQLLPVMAGLASAVNDTVLPAVNGFIEGVKSAWNWIQQNSTWIVPTAIAIGGFATALMLAGIQAKIAAAGGIAQFFTGLLQGSNIMKIVTAAQWLWNAALNANPIMLIITAIAALVAALVWFFTQTELGQQIWTNVMNAIGAVFTWLWEYVIKPVVDFIVAAWNGLMMVFQWLWENVLKPVFDAIAAVFDWIYNYIIVPIIQGIVIYIGIWAAIITWLWEYVIKPVFDFIGAIFEWIYNYIITPIIDGIVLYVKIWAAIFEWLWNYIIKPVFNFIGDIFEWIWNYVIKPIIDYIVLAVKVWGAIFDWLYKNAIKPAIDAIGSVIEWIWKNIIEPTFKWIADAVKTVGKVFEDIFGNVSNFIRDTFERIVGFIKAPINAIIDLINGMIGSLNKLKIDIPEWARDFFGGAKQLGFNIPKIPRLAEGGIIQSRGTVMVGEEGPELLTLPRGAQVTPLDRTESPKTIIYNAAPNQSIDSEQALFSAMKRAKVVVGW